AVARPEGGLRLRLLELRTTGADAQRRSRENGFATIRQGCLDLEEHGQGAQLLELQLGTGLRGLEACELASVLPAQAHDIGPRLLDRLPGDRTGERRLGVLREIGGHSHVLDRQRGLGSGLTRLRARWRY